MYFFFILTEKTSNTFTDIVTYLQTYYLYEKKMFDTDVVGFF